MLCVFLAVAVEPALNLLDFSCSQLWQAFPLYMEVVDANLVTILEGHPPVSVATVTEAVATVLVHLADHLDCVADVIDVVVVASLHFVGALPGLGV